MATNTIMKSAVALVTICLSCAVAAQSVTGTATRKAKLENLAETLQQRDKVDKQAAQTFAQAAGIPLRRELPNGGVLELQRVRPGKAPVFYITNNIYAADTVSTDEVWPGGSLGLNLTGSGMTLGEWDAGGVYDHPDFSGRMSQIDSPPEVSGHSTHVAGTLIGSGLGTYPEARGMAYTASLNAYDWNSDTAEMAAAAASGMLTSNHSYGIAAGWLYLGDVPPDNWWWIGGANSADVEDPNFGYYDSESQLWDQIAYDAPYFLIVKAAGNDRSDTGPAAGEEYRVIDSDGTFLFTSTLPRQPDCAPAGYDCLPTNSVAKNILTVGAVDDISGGYSPVAGPSAVNMTPFSGWGPTDDGRIKPDIVGNGLFLLSTYIPPYFYAAAAGTSMAAPNVTGSLLLLQQHYQNLHGVGSFLTSAGLKALAIHTADESGGAPGPDYEFGWGLLNTRTAADLITRDGDGKHQIIEGSLSNGGEDSYVIDVADTDAVITATLVWMDPPGNPVVPPVLDAPNLMLVNDLDLRIRRAPTTYLPWVLDPANPAAAATTGDNFRDNVEQVEIQGAAAGSYTVKISHKGTLLNNTNQDYALIITVSKGLPEISGRLIDEDFSGGMPSGWTVQTNANGTPWTIKDPVPGDLRLDNLTGGSGKFAMVDNRPIRYTVTSLITPVLDLASYTGVVLRFRSAYIFDFWETINVDVSGDAGFSWVNAWALQGFNHQDQVFALDLSNLLAGQSDARIRFRFDSGFDPVGDYWQVDDVELEVGGSSSGNPPGQASNPNPGNGSIVIGNNISLSWTTGSQATSHDVYFGTQSPLEGSDFQGNQAGTSFNPGTLEYATTYYWRVDEVNADGTTVGPIWSFTTETEPVTPPDPASSPSPANGATGVGINANLSWTAGSLAASHNLYFGTSSLVSQGNQAGTAFNPGTLAYGQTYQWRVDEVNADGTTQGQTWTFTTEDEPLDPPGMSSSPGPENGATGVSININLDWTADGTATAHDVYFGTTSPGSFRINQTETSFDPGTLAYSTTYYWRIDEVNNNGTTTGQIWSFTTESEPLPPPEPETVRLGGLNAAAVPGSGGRWDANVVILVLDQDSNPEAGVTVDGSWSGGSTGTASCITGVDGSCSVTKNNLKSNVASVTFTVDLLTKTAMSYQPGDNVGGNTITVNQSDQNLFPVAVDDSYQTDINTAVSGNVIDNDNEGDGPATIYSNTQPQSGTLNLAPDGSFTYTPNLDFEGPDSFDYVIVDQDGDVSASGAVNFVVSGLEPPPTGQLNLSVTAYKVKGLQHADLIWSNFSGSVDIWRDNLLLMTVHQGNGIYTDNIGAKGGGTYTYKACESGTIDCASAVALF